MGTAAVLVIAILIYVVIKAILTAEDSTSQSQTTECPEVSQQIQSESDSKCKEIDIESLPYIPLPRAPHRWEEKERPKLTYVKITDSLFEIHESESWRLLSTKKIPMKERPDTAFRRLHPINSGLLLIDDLGNSEKSGSNPAAGLRYDRHGDRVADFAFRDDVYRIGINALGGNMVAMSRETVVHAYDDCFNPILRTDLRNFSEIIAAKRRFGIQESELKNCIRTVAVAHDSSRFLFTIIDEAWCADKNGKILWGAKMPVKDGWRKISEPSSKFGTSAEVTEALKYMGLSLPYTDKQFKQRYRELLRKMHPDFNPDNPSAGEQVRKLIGAYELLTGIKPESIYTIPEEKYVKDISRETVEVDGAEIEFLISMDLGPQSAADWIYASNFAGNSRDVFIAGYSGKIVQLNERGEAMRIYDIGAVPRRIIDTGDYLYFLTDTRLYILKEDSLVSVIDTFEKGELVMAQTGFGLLQEYSFQWFSEDGKNHGSVSTKHPIRRVYYTPEGMLVETRQHRATISGVNTWWE